MARIIVPDAGTADRLAALARIAFDSGEGIWSAGDFLALGGPPRAAMIVDDDFGAGLLVLRMAADEAEILNFGVVPAERRRGLGTALLTAAETLARDLGVRRIFLEVAVDNAPATALYARHGFTEAARRPGYYRRGDGSRVDALILRKEL